MKKIVSVLVVVLLFSSTNLTVNADAYNDYSNFNLKTQSGYTVQELQSGLLGGLAPHAEYFIEAERMYGVNAVFLASVAAIESGWGQSEWARRNNLFGYGNGMSFESKEACIYEVANALSKNYLSSEGPYFKGYTINAVNVYYCGSSSWSRAVERIMSEIVYRIEKKRDVPVYSEYNFPVEL